jgi:ABC-2 type transport system permease protein
VSLALAHARAEMLQLLRYPTYAVPTLAFPSLLMVLFGAQLQGEEEVRLLAGISATAVLAVAFFQFGVGIASTRETTWERYVRTLPVRPSSRLAARVLAALAFALASAALVAIVAAVAVDIRLEPWRYVALAAALLVGGVPFALLGIGLGYSLRPRAALPVANLLYLPLAIGGSLWGKPDDPPRSLDIASNALPTRSWMEILEPITGGWGVPPLRHVLALAAWSIAFGAFAWLAYQRDEGERYS